MATRLPRLVALVSDPVGLTACIPEDTLHVFAFTDPELALLTVQQKEVDVVLADEEVLGAGCMAWLSKVRAADRKTSIVLVAGPELPLELVANIHNNVGVYRLMPKPMEVDALLRNCSDAAERYRDDVQRDYGLALSKVRVDRLGRSYDQTCEELAETRTALRQVVGGPEPVVTAESDQATEDLLVSMIRASTPDGTGVRVSALARACCAELGWSQAESRTVEVAAALHHALLPLHPKERRIPPGTGRTEHASRLASGLARLPGFEAIAAVIRFHHERWDEADMGNRSVPRGAHLLQILSRFDEVFHDPSIGGEVPADADDDFRLGRASQAVMSHAGRNLDPMLAERCIHDLIPRFLGRRERIVGLRDIDVGMVLSRSVYNEAMVLLRRGTKLTDGLLHKVQDAGKTHRFEHIWVMDPAVDAERSIAYYAA